MNPNPPIAAVPAQPDALRCAEFMEHIANGGDVPDIGHLAQTTADQLRSLHAQVAALTAAQPTHEQIAAYLQSTGTYVTNDATREAAIADAIAADRASQGAAALELPEPAWRAATIKATEDGFTADQLREFGNQQFNAGREFEHDRAAALRAVASHAQAPAGAVDLWAALVEQSRTVMGIDDPVLIARDDLERMISDARRHATAQAAPAAGAVAGPMDEMAELSLLNRLIELGNIAAGAHATSNSDDGQKGTAAYVQWQEIRAKMGELIRAAYAAAPTPAAQADSGAQEDAALTITWPTKRDVGRIGDMSPNAHLRVGLDNDNDVYVSVWDESGGGSVEFCNPGGGGGGQSSETRMALIALMVAMESDNAANQTRDWWAIREGAALAAKGQKP